MKMGNFLCNARHVEKKPLFITTMNRVQNDLFGYALNTFFKLTGKTVMGLKIPASLCFDRRKKA